MLRRKAQPAMVMTMKKTTSLNISVAESEAKLDASACHPLVGGEARTTLMARWLILAIYLRNLMIALFHKLSAQEAVKQPSARIDQSTPFPEVLMQQLGEAREDVRRSAAAAEGRGPAAGGAGRWRGPGRRAS